MTETIFAGKMPILALRGLCVFPEQTVHFEVGRGKSIKALEAAMQGDQTLLLIPQKDLLVDDPTLKDLYPVGCIAKVKQVLKTQRSRKGASVPGYLSAFFSCFFTRPFHNLNLPLSCALSWAATSCARRSS